MEKTIVIGITESGPDKYNGNYYHNLVLHTSRTDTSNDNVVGSRAEQLKIKYVKLADMFDLGMSQEAVEKLKPKDFQNLIGKEVKVYFDRYRNVDSVQVLNDNKSAQK